jgi:hypothetical protein
MKKLFTIALLLSVTLFTVSSCSDDEVTPPAGGGDVTVVFGDGGTKATAITNLVVDGVTYDVLFKYVAPGEIYGTYPGTFTFTTNADANTALVAINVEFNKVTVNSIGQAGETFDETRYRIGYEAFQTTPGTQTQDNCRFKFGSKQTDWIENTEETAPWNEQPGLIFAEFTKK